MKKITILGLLFCTSFLCAQESFLLKTGLESRAKYERYKKSNSTKLEFNLDASVYNDSSWMDSRIKFVMKDLDSSNKSASIEIDKLLIGHQLYATEDFYSCIEIGRKKLENIFNSKLQFNSHLTGALLSIEYGTAGILCAGNVISLQDNHYGAIAEAYYQAEHMPLKISYSISDWHMKDNVTISQISANYKVSDVLDMPLNIYAMALTNHRESTLANAYCGGVSIGSTNQAKDWMLDVNLQYTEENALTSMDTKSIGKGTQIKAIYCFTDELSVQGKFDYAQHDKLELQAIYKW